MSIKKYVLVVFVVIFFTANVYGYEIKRDLPAPNNFNIFADTMRIGISWEEPDSSSNHLIRYDLYRSDIGKYFSFEELPSEIYYDYMVEYEEYTYYVKAVYWEGESPPSDILSITPFYDLFFTGSIIAYVSDYSGNPIENARVVLDGYNITYSLLSNIDGVAHIDQVRLGGYDVDHYHPCYSSGTYPYSIAFDVPSIMMIYLDFGTQYITTTPTAISHSIDIGTTDSVSLFINNSSNNSFVWKASIYNNSCPTENWVSLSDSIGVILGNDQVELHVYFDATNDTTIATYTCDLSFRINYEVTIAEIPITLEVVNYSIDDEPEEINQTLSAYPNPFSCSTKISFSGIVTSHELSYVKIFNIKGQLVRDLEFSVSDLVISSVWDGKDEYGNRVSSGLYFYQVKAGDEILGTNKCLLLKK